MREIEDHRSHMQGKSMQFYVRVFFSAKHNDYGWEQFLFIKLMFQRIAFQIFKKKKTKILNVSGADN